MRDKKYDIVKGIAIIVMIFCHIIKIRPIRILVYSFHMPLFFIVAGYFFKERGFKTQWQRSFKSLLIPYFCSGLLIATRDFILTYQDGTGLQNACDYLISTAFGIGLMKNNTRFTVGPIWFLICMFVARMLFETVLHFCKSFKSRMIAVLLLSSCGIILGQYVYLPYCFDVAMTSLVFMLYGFYANNIKTFLKQSRFSVPIYILIGVIVSITYYHYYQDNVYLNMISRNYPLYGLSIITAIVAYEIILKLASILQNCALISVVEDFGCNSSVVLCAHAFMKKRILQMISNSLNINYNNNVGFAITIIIFILYFNIKKIVIKIRNSTKEQIK